MSDPLRCWAIIFAGTAGGFALVMGLWFEGATCLLVGVLAAWTGRGR